MKVSQGNGQLREHEIERSPFLFWKWPTLFPNSSIIATRSVSRYRHRIALSRSIFLNVIALG